jgi:hypothetical protein
MSASRLVYPRKQTSLGVNEMSALGQKRTHAVQQAPLFDYLVCDGKHARWNGKPKRLCCFKINHQREPRADSGGFHA